MDKIDILSELLTEKQKSDTDYIQRMTDYICNSLIIDKDHLRKAYNYYNGVIDKDQYRAIEENNGVGSPTSVEFIPLIKRHVDALIGRHLQTRVTPKITCKDKETLSNIHRQKQLKIKELELNAITESLHNNIVYSFMTPEEKQQKKAPVDVASDQALKKLKDDFEKNFISEYELSAQYMLKFLSQNKSIDLDNKKKILMLDLLVAGECFYKTTIPEIGETPDIEVLNPIDVFYEKNVNSPYVKDSTRAVVRRYMNKQQIISKYGNRLSKEDIERIDTQIRVGTDYSSNVIYVRSSNGSIVSNTGVASSESFYDNDISRIYNSYYPVYEVEWLTNTEVEEGEKKFFRTDRYEAIRIGNDIYIDLGKSENVIRSIEHPNRCSLSINGMSYSDRNGKPFSLVIATIPLQDKYNLLHYFRDSLISSSGVKGDFLDISQLPSFLGKTPQERVLKWSSYKKKLGVAMINTAQEGREQNLNTIYSGYDDTVSAQSIQAIHFAIEQTEATCSSITGIFKEQLGGIETRDAVSNVQVGLNQSTIITKQYFQVMDNIVNELLIDAINASKITYKEGIVGSYILGDYLQKIFTIEPKYFSFTDYDIHIADNTDITNEMMKIEQLTYELIKSKQVGLDVVLSSIGSESLSDMKHKLMKSFEKQAEENSQLEQASQAITQYEEQIKQLQSEMEKTKNEFENMRKQNNDIELKKVEYDYDVRKEANKIKEKIETKKIKNDDKRIEAELIQLYDENPYNNEIKNS